MYERIYCKLTALSETFDTIIIIVIIIIYLLE